MKKVWFIPVLIAVPAVAILVWQAIELSRSIQTPGHNQPAQTTITGTAPAQTSKPPADYDEIRIAVAAPISALPRGTRSHTIEAATVAVREINSRGGIHGTPVRMIPLDDKGTALGARAAARKAVAAKAHLVVGGRWSSAALAMAEVLQENRIPMLVISGTNPYVTRKGEYIFRVCFNDSLQGAALVRFARNHLKADTVAILTNSGNAYSPFLSDVFAEQFRNLGGKVVLRQDYLTDQMDAEELIQNVAKAKPDLVFNPGYVEGSSAILAEARRQNLETRFLGADGWTPELLSLIEDTPKSMYSATHWMPGLSDHPRSYLLKVIEDQYGPIANSSAALTLDAMYLAFEAMERANRLTHGKIRQAIADTADFPGLTGKIEFDRYGDCYKPITVQKFTNGTAGIAAVIQPRWIQVAVIMAKTGDAGLENIMGFQAARFAADEINRYGGPRGIQLRLREYDNRGTVLGSRRAARQAIKDGAVAVIGAAWSSHSLAAARVCQKAQIPMLSPSATSPGVTQVGDYIFRACFIDLTQAAALAAFANQDLKASTAVILTNTSTQYSLGLADYFREEFSESGKILWEGDYAQETTNFKPLLRQVARLEPDVVFVPGYPRDAGFIIRTARRMGLETTFLGADGWDNLMYDYAGDAIEGSYFTDHWHYELPTPVSKEFSKKYIGKYRNARTGLVALTYDSVYLLADAVGRAESTEPEDIRNALSRTAGFEGVTGTFTFNEFGDPIKPVVILKFEDGDTVLHKLFERKEIASQPSSAEMTK
ncbi:MAG: ABC transporter substrate-binding protein [Phycisphaerae bacterium]